MVKAINSGGEAQSIADFMVLESQPDRMVEVTKMMVFSDMPSTDPRKVGFLLAKSFFLLHIFLSIQFFFIVNFRNIFKKNQKLVWSHGHGST